MKLKLTPLILSVVLSSGVLFGGWFLYHSMAMENPLHKKVTEIEGVEQAEIVIGSETVLVELTLDPDASLREIVAAIQKEAKSIIGKRSLVYTIANESSPELDHWWASVLFEVAQAMDTRHYASIPAVLQEKAGDAERLKAKAEMDDHYVYIRLTGDDASKFVMLPRQAGRLEVW